jgi:hypothetical protein
MSASLLGVLVCLRLFIFAIDDIFHLRFSNLIHDFYVLGFLLDFIDNFKVVCALHIRYKVDYEISFFFIIHSC